jgi:predicted RNA-binding Zn-ribbon protein involved in translation (DUF1610 family)
VNKRKRKRIQVTDLTIDKSKHEGWTQYSFVCPECGERLWFTDEDGYSDKDKCSCPRYWSIDIIAEGKYVP